MNLYPYVFQPVYKEKIWGGNAFARLFGRDLPAEKVGESWELADLAEGTTTLANGPDAGATLTEMTAALGRPLLGPAAATGDGRFPLLLKFLDANDILSLQVHPDAAAVREIGPPAALKTECWYVIESRDGYIYKGVREGVTPEQFRRAVEENTVEEVVRRVGCRTGDFHYLPAGTVHALGPGLVVAEIQTPSDTTYRVTDWGRGREIHVERSMQCIHFEPTDDACPGAAGETLLETEYFSVALRRLAAAPGRHAPARRAFPQGRCIALMVLAAPDDTTVRHGGPVQRDVPVRAGQTILIPAGLRGAEIESAGEGECVWLEASLPKG